MTIAEKMLELLDEGWGKTALRAYCADGKIAYRCAVGIRLDVSEETCHIRTETTAARELQGDPVTGAMARIIREQYPEFTAGLEREAMDKPYVKEVLAKDANLIIIFNDRIATVSGIRAIIEKVIAEGL